MCPYNMNTTLTSNEIYIKKNVYKQTIKINLTENIYFSIYINKLT